MEDNSKPTESGETPKINEDYFKDIEKRIDSKIGEQTSKLAELAKSQGDLIAALNSQNQAKSTKPDEDLSSLMYSDPEAFARKIEERTEKKLSAQNQRRADEQAELTRLVQEFPELNDPNHDVTAEAIRIYGSLSDSDKSSKLAYRSAVSEAALKHGLLPKSKRAKADPDGFTLGGGKGGRSGTPKVDNRMMEFARTLARASGRDIDSDKGYADRLAGIAKNYTKKGEE